MRRDHRFIAGAIPAGGLAPAIGDPVRGRYLQWLFFSGSSIEAAITQKFANVQMPEVARAGAPSTRCLLFCRKSYGAAPILLGDRVSAADVLIASDLHFVIDVFKMVEPRPEFSAYLERCRSRPAFYVRAEAIDVLASEARPCSASKTARWAGRGATDSTPRAPRGPWRSRSRPGLPVSLSRVLAGRGVAPETAVTHLDPTLRALLPRSPSRSPRWGRRPKRWCGAVRAAAKPLRFSAIMMSTAPVPRRCWRNFSIIAAFRDSIHIPDRITEGYGPNSEAIRALAARGATLLVTADCGTTSFEPFVEARRLGMDVIVLDHHQAPEVLPDAIVRNPNRQDDVSGQGALCAAGVAFVALVALNRALRQRGFWRERLEPDLLPRSISSPSPRSPMSRR